jgi:hypothetical protein
MLRYNKNMEYSLNSIKISHENFLKKIIMIYPEFIEKEGFILLQKGIDTDDKLDVDRILSLYHDKTGFEASYNEIRVEDYFDWCIEKPLEGLAIAFKITDIWECKLKSDFPNYKFCIIIGFDGNFTTIRFHKYREEEGNWVSLDNLDSYKEESIAVRIV